MATTFQSLRDSASGALEKAKLSVGIESASSDVEEEQPPDPLDELAEYCPKLSFQQRIIGFFASFSLGYLITFFSFRFFIKLVEGNPLPFAINYTVGHILQLLASTFLCGPQRQFKRMFDDSRRTTSIVYLSGLGLTIFFIFIPLPSKLKLLVLILLTLTQFSASVWYSLSYIPYGRRTFLRFAKGLLGIEERSSYDIPGLTSSPSS